MIKKGIPYKEYKINTQSINRIIAGNFERVPDVLSLDAEGLDFEILKDLDMEKYPIKIICCETIKRYKAEIEDLMKANGYRLSATTCENEIWVHDKDLWKKD